MANKLREITDKELIKELSRRFDHVSIELMKDIDDTMYVCHDVYKGQFDPDYKEEWVDVEIEDDGEGA